MMDKPIERDKLHNYIEAMKDHRVLVIGDIMLDRFVYGSVDRVSAEAPVPVLLQDRVEDVPGGAGNVLANLSSLGALCHIISIVGDDSQAMDLKELVKGLGADPGGLLMDETRPTIVKNRFLAGGQQLLRVDSEKVKPLSSALEDSLMEKAGEQIGNTDVLILSDYGKGVLSRSVTARLIGLAKEHDVPVLIDPKGDDYSKYNGASIVTPNGKELSLATGGMKTGSDDEVIDAAMMLQKTSGIASVLATRSQDGMTLLEDGQAPVHIRATARDVFDVTGAGDTVIATMAAAMAAGASMYEAAMLSNLAGGLVVAKVGTVPITAAELSEELVRQGTASGRNVA